MDKYTEMINKSLDEIDNLAVMSEELVKSEDSKEVSPSDVSEDAPKENESSEEEKDNQDDPVSSQEDTDADSEGQEDAGEEEETEKSLKSILEDNDDVKKSLEVSDFLQELVKGVSAVLEQHGASLSKSIQGNSQTQEYLAKSFEGIVKSQQVIVKATSSLQKSVAELTSRLEKVESTPVRKSVTSTKAIEKSFDHSAGGNVEKDKPQLTKSQISSKLFQGVQEQKFGHNDLLAFESTGSIQTLSPEARNYLGL